MGQRFLYNKQTINGDMCYFSSNFMEHLSKICRGCLLWALTCCMLQPIVLPFSGAWIIFTNVVQNFYQSRSFFQAGKGKKKKNNQSLWCEKHKSWKYLLVSWLLVESIISFKTWFLQVLRKNSVFLTWL